MTIEQRVPGAHMPVQGLHTENETKGLMKPLLDVLPFYLLAVHLWDVFFCLTKHCHHKGRMHMAAVRSQRSEPLHTINLVYCIYRGSMKASKLASTAKTKELL